MEPLESPAPQGAPPLARALAERLACPTCHGHLDQELACRTCRIVARPDGGIVDFLQTAEPGERAGEVRAFYEARPFPGYAPGDDAPALIDRGRRSSFLRALDAALTPGAAVLDCGCGTAQVAAFLALCAARRDVVAVDGCRASLRAAEGFRSRAGLENLHLVRADLFALPLAPASFDVVVCRGVVHHTERPFDAIDRVAERVAPGGVLVLGFYERFARAPHALRRLLGRRIGRPITALDPLLRRRDLDPEKKRTWIEDQYRHPLERRLALPRVLAHLEARGFTWLRSVPPLDAGADLFAPTPRPGPLGLLARRLAWAARGLGDEDAGLVGLLVRRHRR